MKDSKVKGYAPPIATVRHPSQTIRLFVPSNQYPSATVDCSNERWEDGMMTYKYSNRLQGKGTEWLIKHVFTSNKEALQVEAGELLVAIQENVELRRVSGSKAGTCLLPCSNTELSLIR
jgi:hypothetical protein